MLQSVDGRSDYRTVSKQQRLHLTWYQCCKQRMLDPTIGLCCAECMRELTRRQGTSSDTTSNQVPAAYRVDTEPNYPSVAQGAEVGSDGQVLWMFDSAFVRVIHRKQNASKSQSLNTFYSAISGHEKKCQGEY